MRLWADGHQEEAILSWRQALACNAEHLEAMVSLAWALGQQGQVEEGLGLAERALQLAQGDPAIHRVMGELRFLGGRYEEAMRHYRTSLELDPDDSSPLSGLLHRDLGDALYMLERFEEAAQEYRLALARGSDEAYCRLWLGWARHRLGDEGAIEEFESACELAPDWHEPCYAAGYLHCARGDYQRACHRLDQALALYPPEDDQGRAAAACELGNARRGLGDLPRAIELYQQSLSLDPTHPVARFNLGLAYAEQGDFEQALAAFQVAAQLEPEDEEIQIERGRAYLELGRWHDGLEAYQAALAIRSDSAEALAGLGVAYHSLGLYGAAVEHYQHALTVAPDDARTQYNLATALEASGRHAEADAAMERAWEVGHNDPEMCLESARALTAQGRNAEGGRAGGAAGVSAPARERRRLRRAGNGAAGQRTAPGRPGDGYPRTAADARVGGVRLPSGVDPSGPW